MLQEWLFQCLTVPTYARPSVVWCRFCIQSILNVVEYLLKAPFNALLWASGKPWKEKQKDVESH